MALRPFSLLLLLLVMIPEISMLVDETSVEKYTEMTCQSETWFCFRYENRKFSTRYLLESAHGWSKGGIAIDATKPDEWEVHFNHYFDNKKQEKHADRCNVIISSTYRSQQIQCKKVIEADKEKEFDINGISIVPIHYRSDWAAIVFKLRVDPGAFVADKFQLFANPELKLGFYVKQNSGNDDWVATTPGFKPYECKIQNMGQKPDDSAVEAIHDVSTFSCRSGTIFLEGTNTYQPTVYCGGEGWFGMDKKMILKRAHSEKHHPYCLEDVMFEDCTKNKCFVYGDALKVAQPANLLVKVDDPAEIKEKLGAYLVFESDTKWKLHLAQKNGFLGWIKIGALSFRSFTEDKNKDKVMKTVVRSGQQLISGLQGSVFTFEADPNEPKKDLMDLFEFYTGGENKIKLTFTEKSFEADGVANFGKYQKTTAISFVGVNAEMKNTPNVHNLFTCDGEKRIYLDNERTGENEIRFTAKRGWLKKDGTSVAEIKKDPSGKDIIPAVNCFTVCQAETLTLTTTPKPTKEQAKMEYKCNGDLVKVDSKLYTSITCENDQWTGDGNNIAAPAPKFTFGAECYGGFKFVRDCAPAESDMGCGEVKNTNGVLTCEDGFSLTLKGHDESKIRKSLSINKNDEWVDGTDVIAKTQTGDRPLCYSKCASQNVITKANGPDSVDAQYSYIPGTKTGTLKCPDTTHVLVLTLDGKKVPFVKDVVCDKDGWKFGAEVAVGQQSVRVQAECFKSCAPERLAEEACPTGWHNTRDCGTSQYSALKVLSCPDTHMLIVNDKQISTPLECTRAGWVKKGTTPSPDALIIDHTSNYNEKVKAGCFAKCGKKFVTAAADITIGRTDTQLDLRCTDESHMISYELKGAKEEDTLEDLKCEDKIGWNSGSTPISAFSAGVIPTVNVKCKSSCDQALIKKKCEDRSKGCEEATLTGKELTCKTGKWLYAQDKVEINTMECKRKTFASKAPSTAIKIDRTSPTSTAEISCISKCDKSLMVTADASDLIAKKVEEAGKFTGIDDNGKYVAECMDDLHYTTINHGDTKQAAKWTCDPATGWNSQFLDWFDGKLTKIGCLNKCKNRIEPRASSCISPGCNLPKDDNNDLECENTHVLRIGDDTTNKFVIGKLQCKKDGFYEKDSQVLKFEDIPDKDTTKFKVSCISKCSNAFVKYPEFAATDSTARFFAKTLARNAHTDPLKCELDGHLLIIDEQRLIAPATCDEVNGWKNSANEIIAPFTTDRVNIVAKCAKVCDSQLMLKEKCPTQTLNKCDRKAGSGTAPDPLTCPQHHRLFLNGKESKYTGDDVINTMTCEVANGGWMAVDELIVDFRDKELDLTTPLEVECRHKCNKEFIDFKFDESCPPEKCSEALFDEATSTLSCSDKETQILVIEHEKVRREGFEAVCSKDGWKDKEATPNVLFDLGKFNYHIKAHCEQLCVFNVDKTADSNQTKNLLYDAAAKTLTCNDTNEMLVLEGEGVYSDMTCAKEGWKTDANVLKVDFKPIIADGSDPNTIKQENERKKRFTCAINNCMRPFPCDDGGVCVNPDFEKKKYQMSCESPSKLAKKGSDKGSISYDFLRCFDGDWKINENDQTPVIARLTKDELAKPERPPFDMVCTAAACTSCKQEDLTALTSTTDANIRGYTWINGSFTTCSGFKCGTGLQFAIKGKDGKLKYYENKGDNSIKCTKTTETAAPTFSSPDGKESIDSRTEVGCVTHIPCNEHRPFVTDCEDKNPNRKLEGCDSEGLQQKLKIGSISSTHMVKCDTLGQLYFKMHSGNNGWKIVNELQCTAGGDWSVSYLEEKDKPESARKIEKLPEKMKTNPSKPDEELYPHFICALLDPNPGVEIKEKNSVTDTCSYCPFPPMPECKKDCKKPDGHATTTNDGHGKCTMTIVNGRFKINDGDEIGKDSVLVCQNINKQFNWLTPDGKKIDSLAVIMNEMDNVNKGAIAGIIIGVILVLGLIVFGIAYIAIKKRRAKEQTEKLKSKGLEQKIDTIIESATIIDDTKTLVL